MFLPRLLPLAPLLHRVPLLPLTPLRPGHIWVSSVIFRIFVFKSSSCPFTTTTSSSISTSSCSSFADVGGTQ